MYPIARGKDQDANLFGWHPESQILVWMDPDKFLKLSGVTDENYHQLICPENVLRLANRIRAGEPTDPAWLDLQPDGTISGHEGRHRALACEELGCALPVIIYHRDGDAYLDIRAR